MTLLFFFSEDIMLWSAICSGFRNGVLPWAGWDPSAEVRWDPPQSSWPSASLSPTARLSTQFKLCFQNMWDEVEQSLEHQCSELLILHFLWPLLSLTNYDEEAGKENNPARVSSDSLCMFIAEQAELFGKAEGECISLVFNLIIWLLWRSFYFLHFFSRQTAQQQCRAKLLQYLRWG